MTAVIRIEARRNPITNFGNLHQISMARGEVAPVCRSQRVVATSARMNAQIPIRRRGGTLGVIGHRDDQSPLGNEGEFALKIGRSCGGGPARGSCGKFSRGPMATRYRRLRVPGDAMARSSEELRRTGRLTGRCVKALATGSARERPQGRVSGALRPRRLDPRPSGRQDRLAGPRRVR